MAETLTIPDDTATHYEQLIRDAEAMRQAGADALKSAYRDLRDDLKQLGWGGATISAEVAAFKGAIAEIGLSEKEKNKREAKGERVDDYVSLLTRARARAALNKRERFEPTTGEILDDADAVIEARQEVISKHGLAGALSAALGVEVEIVRVNSPSAPATQGEAEAPSVKVSPATIDQPNRLTSDVEAFGANAGGDDVESSRGPASTQDNDTRPAGRVESGIDLSLIDQTASGPDDKRALNSPAMAEVRSASTDAPETPGKQCTSVVSKDEAGQNLTGNPNSPETANETVGGFPVAAAPTSAEETGATQQRDTKADEVPHHLGPTRGDDDGIADSDRRSHGQAAGRSPESQTDGNETVTVGGDESGTAVPEFLKASGAFSQPKPSEDDNGIRYEAVPPMPMKSLGYAHCFPELTQDAFQRLKTDIEINGVLEPIVRMGDVIVDGWNRYNAARSLKIEYPVIAYTGNDVLTDVIKWQRSSRDWYPAQERKIAAALAKEIPHRADDIRAAFHIIDEEEDAA